MRVPLVVVLALAGVVALGPSSPTTAQELPGFGRPAVENEEPAREISQASSKTEDRAIEKRLLEIFGQVEGLGSVSVEVRAGVIRLSGEVLSGRAREKAEELAHQIARFPQSCVRADRRSAIRQHGLPMRDALVQEWRNGLPELKRGGLEGAARFRDGLGRHGDFSKT